VCFHTLQAMHCCMLCAVPPGWPNAWRTLPERYPNLLIDAVVALLVCVREEGGGEQGCSSRFYLILGGFERYSALCVNSRVFLRVCVRACMLGEKEPH
jgi:hypothetical protein